MKRVHFVTTSTMGSSKGSISKGSSHDSHNEEDELKKYKTYSVDVDPDQEDRATEIKLCNFQRPHMRAFHMSWICFFLAFFIWFAISPLLLEVKNSLGISKQDIWTSSITSVAGTSMMRFILGPLCDKYGARILMGIVLMSASIPAALIGLVTNKEGLAAVRFFIGLGGSSFVMCQFWATRMFTKEIAGTANALVGGWGNLGGGVTQIFMGSVLFPLFTRGFGLSNDRAWRTVSIIPAVVAFIAGFLVIQVTDDCPKGNYKEMKRNGTMQEVSATASFRAGATNLNTWILFIHYGCCFGVELTMNNAAAIYFQDQFNQSTESAAAIASIFGFMNLFARGIGGFSSDKLNAKMGMRGRLLVQLILLLVEASLIFIFANTTSLGGSIIVLVFFSIFVQSAEGSTYGIVPYVNPASTGSIAGIVGAGGNIGAVAFGLAFRQLDPFDAFYVMGGCVFGAAGLCFVLLIQGHRGLVTGKDNDVVKNAWQNPGKPTPSTGLQVPVMTADAEV